MSPELIEIYKSYPRHVAKVAAIRAIEKAVIRLFKDPREFKVLCDSGQTAWGFLLDRTKAFAKSPAGNRGHYTPHPATWFNKSRYLDEEDEWWQLNAEERKAIENQREANVGVWRPE